MNHPPSEDYFGTVSSHYIDDVWRGKTCILAFKMNSHLQYFNFLRLPSPLSGRCARCGDNVVGDGSGCIAMEQVFHVECFTCITCHARLRGQPFYALDKKSYCESCYIVSKGTTNTKSIPLLIPLCHFFSDPYACSYIPEYIRALFKVLQAHPGPYPASHGEGLPPSLFHVCGL